MSDADRSHDPDRAFLLLLTPLTAVSLPSLVFCALELVLWLRSSLSGGRLEFHLPPENGWDQIFAMQSSVYLWVAHWNSIATLAATGFLIFTLIRPRWRHWTGLALIPYGVLLCADFTLRLRTALLP